MEFSPEIAVFQSAFQLLSLKAGHLLAELPKELCPSYVTIISTSVAEICHGLEHDLDTEESLLWQQKLHSLVLYALVKKKYRVEQDQRLHHIPVCSQLDMLSRMLPTFSCQFYFELMKQCSWTHLFLQSLSYLDMVTASTLCQSALSHLTTDPVTANDTKVIAMVAETLLSRSLCLPEPSETLTEKLLQPLMQSQKYVQTVYPDEIENYTKNSGSVESQSVKSKISEEDTNQYHREKIGSKFWEIFSESSPDLILNILNYFDGRFTSVDDDDYHDDVVLAEDLLHSFGQISLLWYLVVEGRRDDLFDSWLVHNLHVIEIQKEGFDIVVTGHSDATTANYCINYGLVEQMVQQISVARLVVCVERGLDAIFRCPLKDKICKEINSNKNWITIISNLSLNSTVLFRMLHGTMYNIENSRQSENSSKVMECSKTLQKPIVNTGLTSDSGLVPEEFCVSADDDSWKGDVTLSALLWRIGNRLSQYEVCVEKLLSGDCLAFWNNTRVYQVLNDNIRLLGRPDRVLRLLEISLSVCTSASREITHSLLQLICSAFTELSFPDQDHVVMLMYRNEGGSLVEQIVGMEASRKLQMTNLFNKITAERDDQILQDLMLLCLVDPVPVIRGAVDMCVKNEDQANNFAMVLQYVYEVCRTRHSSLHCDTSLISMILHDFLSTTALMEKEEKHFITFVTGLMQPQHRQSGEIKPALLSPVEFLHTSVLPCVHVENLRYSNSPMACKFALNLLVASLDAGSNKHCDWSEFEFEPVAVVVNLAQILHECVALWEDRKAELPSDIADPNKEGLSQEPADQLKPVLMDTGITKLVVKETTSRCLEKFSEMLQDRFLEKWDDVTLTWLFEMTRELHWLVRLQLSSVFTTCGWEQYGDGWKAAFEELTSDLSINFTSTLLFVSTDRRYIDTYFRKELWREYSIGYEDVIKALYQVLPNLLQSEIHNVVMFLAKLFGHDLIPLVYRMCSSPVLPLTDLTGVKPVLCVSQLLRDVIVTLTLTQDQKLRSQMLQHVVQCFVPEMKALIDVEAMPPELQHFTLCQIFCHVCDVTDCLPAGTVDSTLVLLLHIVTKFKDISTRDVEKVKGVSKENEIKNSIKYEVKMIKNLENSMLSSVTKLPDIYEEKHMLLKKLQD